MIENELTGTKIILIEDNQFLSDLIKIKLSLSGADVLCYKNGLEGLAAIREHKPHLVLMDIAMPVMNGYQVLEVLATENIIPTLPVIIISNSGQPVEIDRVLQLGAVDYLIKANFNPEEVISKVYLALGLTQTELISIDELPDDTHNGTEIVTGARVLVVEDDSLLQNILTIKFTSHNSPFMFCNDGLRAVSAMENFKPEVVILDLMLPGKTGFEILSDMKAHATLSKVPVIIFSNRSSDEDKETAMNLGASVFFVKAMTDLHELMATIEKIKVTTAA